MKGRKKRIAKKWGYYNIYLKGKGFWVKKLHFKNASTSLQYHNKRDEIWMIYVPKGVIHKVGGCGDVYELAIGEPRERDIVRLKECGTCTPDFASYRCDDCDVTIQERKRKIG